MQRKNSSDVKPPSPAKLKSQKSLNGELPSLRSFYNFDKFDSNYMNNVKAFMISKKKTEASTRIQLTPE